MKVKEGKHLPDVQYKRIDIILLSNMFTNLNLTDIETCYKLFRTEVIKGLAIQQDRFGIEPEITAKVAKARCRIYGVGISYYGRSYGEGKKIGWKDGVKAVYVILTYGVFRQARVQRPCTRNPLVNRKV